MVRNALVEVFDHVPRPIIAVGNQFHDGQGFPAHAHRRSQLLYGASGVVRVATAHGAWVMPPQRGMWIPAGIVHDVRMLGSVQTCSLYLEPAACGGMPSRCEVLGISSFMRSLVTEAVDVPAEYDPDSRAGALMTLIQHEMRRLPVLPLSLPFPAHPQLGERCRRFLAEPSPHETIEQWSSSLHMSRRGFTRLFRQEVGISFATWRQQACLMAALPRLVAGEPVTTVAIDLGYENPAAFTAMFKRVLGTAPRQYLQRSEGRGTGH